MIALIDLNRDTTWAPASSRPGTGGVHSQAQQQDLAYSRWTDAQRIAYHPMQAGRYCGLRHRWELQAAQTYGILARRTRTDAQRIAHRPAHGLLGQTPGAPPVSGLLCTDAQRCLGLGRWGRVSQQHI